MKKSQTFTAKIDKLVPGGQGIATLENGKKAFIWNTLPGEEVVFYTTKEKKSYCEGIASEIKQASKFRIPAKDTCYLSTSPWQIFDYDYELAQKTQLVQESFRQNHLEVDASPIITDGKDYHYRNKMEYSLYWDNDQSKIFPAFHQRGSHRKIPITQSSIERPEIFQAVQDIVASLNAKNEEARKYQSILIRCDQKGSISSALFENNQPHPKMANLTDKILDTEYSYSPNGFFQINIPVYELVLKEINSYIDTQKVLDLYAGVGSIGLSVTTADQELILVESNKDAFSELVANCRRNFIRPLRDRSEVATEEGRVPLVKTGGRDTCRGAGETMSFPRIGETGLINPILDKSENVPNYIEPDQTVILDPPRAGCDEKLIGTLNQKKPQTIIYLSCNPITQVRDIAGLVKNYDIQKVQPYNFFPRTPHIENLVVLKLRSNSASDS